MSSQFPNGLVSINGAITRPEDGKISVIDRGFLFADSVFEVYVAFGTKILDCKPHLERLYRSAEYQSIPIPSRPEELEFELQTLLETVSYPKTYVRQIITRGEGLGLNNMTASLNRIVFCLPAPQFPKDKYETGISLSIAEKQLGKRGPAAKTGDYSHTIAAISTAQRNDFDDILWINTEGEVCEAATANIFFMERDGDNVRFVTPPSMSGILQGITRQRVMTLLNNAKIPCVERVIYRDEIPRFDEAFVSSTVRGLIPICAINNHKLNIGSQQSTFKHVNRLFMAWVESEIGYRPDWRTGESVIP